MRGSCTPAMYDFQMTPSGSKRHCQYAGFDGVTADMST